MSANPVVVDPTPPRQGRVSRPIHLQHVPAVAKTRSGQRRGRTLLSFALLLAISILGFFVMGYHPGAEDDGVYLTAIKADLNPALFPHDSDFFKLQLRATVFDTWMAKFVRVTGISLSWSELLWQFISIFCIVVAYWTIVCQLFEDTSAQWAGVATVAAMFTLPVAGTALYIVDQYLHPRSIATVFILFAVSRIMAKKTWQSVPLLLLACLLHPMMGAFGISFCTILALAFAEPIHLGIRGLRRTFTVHANAPVAALVPLGWMFDRPSPIWFEALHSRHWFRLYEWTWYEWLGAVGPLMLFWLTARLASRQGQTTLARFSTAILIYGVFQQSVAMLILGPPGLIGLSALEPMRYLHLVYIFLTMIGGAYLGKYVLKRRLWRWAVFLLIANGGMFIAQRQVFAGTEHIEWPGRSSANQWLQAFEWIRQNTPQDAYFALDPKYMTAPGEDYHSFRALAERSMLADAIKDTSVVTKVPELGPVWERQVNARKRWESFDIKNFERLKSDFGANWALVSYAHAWGHHCIWHNERLAVCEIR